MALTVSLRPGVLSWSRNPIRYSFAYTAMSASARLRVRIYVHDAINVVTTVQYPYPATSGTMVLYVNELIDPKLSWVRPSFLTAGAPAQTIEEMVTNIKWFRIAFEITVFGSTGYTNDLPSPDRLAIKGGIGDMTYTAEDGYNQASITSKPTFLPRSGSQFLTWAPSGRRMQPDEWGWLLWLSDISGTQEVIYGVTYLDGTTATFTRSMGSLINPDFKYRNWYIPTGVTQAGLDPTGKGVAFFDVRVHAVAAPAVPLESYRVNVDNRPNYNPLALYYRNSLGGWDNIMLRGDWERTGEVERSEYEQQRTIAVNGANNWYASSFRPKWKVNTGFIGKDHMAALADLFNSTECALLHNGQWLPVKVTSQTWTDFRTADSLQSAGIELEAAGTFTSFPRQLQTL